MSAYPQNKEYQEGMGMQGQPQQYMAQSNIPQQNMPPPYIPQQNMVQPNYIPQARDQIDTEI